MRRVLHDDAGRLPDALDRVLGHLRAAVDEVDRLVIETGACSKRGRAPVNREGPAETSHRVLTELSAFGRQIDAAVEKLAERARAEWEARDRANPESAAYWETHDRK